MAGEVDKVRQGIGIKPVKIVLKKDLAKVQVKATGELETQKRRPCGHRVVDEACSVHVCCACYIRKLLGRYYEEPVAEKQTKETGGNTMGKKVVVKAAKVVKSEKRVTAAGILVEQFALKTVKSNEELVKMIREATGSTKFDVSQLSWYKTQYRAGKMKGQNGKPGHLIAQGSLMKPAAAVAKAKVKAKGKVAKKVVKEEEEPIEG